MADASNAQTSFLSGEWSPYAQGRFDDPEYKRGMNVCRNGHPIEAGAWTRRVGTRHKAFTRKGQPAKIIEFSFSQSAPYDMEFTEGYLRFYDSQGLIMSEEPRRVSTITTSTPARVTTSAACTELTAWATGDTVVFNMIADGAPAAAGLLLGRQFSIVTDGDENNFFIYDAMTGLPVNGETVAYLNTTPMVISRVYEIATPYVNGGWKQINAVQDGDQILLLHPRVKPYVVFAPIDGGNLFTLNASQATDGPYLDPPIDGSLITISGVTGTISCEIIYPTYSAAITYKNGTRFFSSFQTRSGSISTSTQYARDTIVKSAGIYYVSLQDGNIAHTPASSPTYWRALTTGQSIGPAGLTSDDIGRVVRLFAEPLDWLVGTAYIAKNLVKYQDAYYVALQASTGKVPGADPDNWSVASNAAAWTWGIITAVASATQFSLSIQGDDILYNQNVNTFRLGAWADSTSYPTNGTFHESRFWLGGAIKNRFDASAQFGNTLEFTPTAPDGTVSDANAISYSFKSPQQNQILWMTPDDTGIIAGTAQGEWVIRSSANNDPITPTSIQAHNFTKIGSANVQAIRTGMSLAFVQRFGKKLMDYIGDPFGHFAAQNLSERAKHLTTKGIERIAYQHELIPTIWANTTDGVLIGTTYKRESVMPGQPPTFNGWHRHDLGSGFNVIDVSASASPGGLLDSVTLVTQDPDSGICRVETLTEFFDEESPVTNAWFLDNGQVPGSALVANVSGVDGVYLTGLGQSEGETVQAFIGGIDLGDFTITNGKIFVPFSATVSTAAAPTFTLAYMQALSGDDFFYTVRVQYTNPVAGVKTMMEFPSIGSPYLDAYTYLNYGSLAITDWAHDRITIPLTGSSPYSGFVQYRISTGALIQYVRIATVFGKAIPAYYDAALVYAASPVVVGSDGRIYNAQVSGSFNVDPTTSGQKDWEHNATPTTVPAAYSAITTYTTASYVTSGGNVYHSLQNGNTGNTPASSPTWWKLMWATPTAWSATTVYGAVTQVMGNNDHIYTTMQAVPAGSGDPATLTATDNKYYSTNGGGYIYTIRSTVGLDYNGDIYMFEGGSTNFPFVKIDGDTLVMKGFAQAAAGQSVPTPATYYVPLRILTNNFTKEADFILETADTSPLGVSAPVAILIETDNLLVTNNNTFTLDEGASPYACAGSPAVGIGQAFVLTRPVAGQPTIASVGLYEINVFSQNSKFIAKPTSGIYKPQDPNKGIYGNYGPKGSAKRKIGTISPQNIDPLWSFFVDFGGLVFDKRDGNIITTVTTQNPTAWDTTQNFAIAAATILGYTLGSDGNIYRFVRPAVYSGATTYAINNVVSDVATGTSIMYKSLANGNVGNPLSDATKWVRFTQDPTTDASHTYWTLLRAAAVTLKYMVKFTSGCAQQVWRIADIDFGTSAANAQFINIENGHFTSVQNVSLGVYNVHKVNTISGTKTSAVIAGDVPLGAGQIADDKTGYIIQYPQYDSTQVGAPTRVDPAGGTTHVSFTGWGRLKIEPDALVYKIPGVVGYTYTSQGQLLRPVSPAESGARNGPAFGKTRRNHRYAVAVANTAGISFGSVFTKVHPALFKSQGGKGALLLSAATLYTGEHSDTVEGDYDLDGMLCWQITRPLPATVTALGGFLQTQDR